MVLRRDSEVYMHQLQQLMPPGIVWTSDPGAVINKLLRAFGEELARVEGRAGDLINESDPRITDELLDEWWRFLGFPDECTADLVTDEDRRVAIVARLALIGGQSAAFFINQAATLGFVISITEYRPFVAGPGTAWPNGKDALARAGDAITNGDWVHRWDVHANASVGKSFLAGSGKAGDPLRSGGSSVLECFLERAKPAHTVLRFVYDQGLITPAAPSVTVVPAPSVTLIFS